MDTDLVHINNFLNTTFMNENNLQFLKDGLKYMGFGEKLHADLESKIKEQPADFQLTL